jgi:hypothetical protein
MIIGKFNASNPAFHMYGNEHFFSKVVKIYIFFQLLGHSPPLPKLKFFIVTEKP